MNRIKKEWQVIKSDFKRQAEDSLAFRINWYILKPLVVLMCIVAVVIL